jgi:4-amino-4-deoxychorismate lyase
VHAGTLATPRLDRCGVAGIMRAVVGGLAAECGIDFQERRLEAADLQQAQEIFLTNALIGIRPVREVAGRALAIGPLTRRLQQALAPLLGGAPDRPA